MRNNRQPLALKVASTNQDPIPVYVFGELRMECGTSLQSFRRNSYMEIRRCRLLQWEDLYVITERMMFINYSDVS